jgi:hypothetical protein
LQAVSGDRFELCGQTATSRSVIQAMLNSIERCQMPPALDHRLDIDVTTITYPSGFSFARHIGIYPKGPHSGSQRPVQADTIASDNLLHYTDTSILVGLLCRLAAYCAL